MARIAAALLIVVSFLMLAPIIESGTSESTQFFQAVGNAADVAPTSPHAAVPSSAPVRVSPRTRPASAAPSAAATSG